MRPASGGPDRDRFGGPDHAVEHPDGKGDLALLTGQGAGAQPGADGGLVSADPRLRQAALAVAGGLLPNHTTMVANELDVPVALARRRVGLGTGHRRRARRYDGGGRPLWLPALHRLVDRLT